MRKAARGGDPEPEPDDALAAALARAEAAEAALLQARREVAALTGLRDAAAAFCRVSFPEEELMS